MIFYFYLFLFYNLSSKLAQILVSGTQQTRESEIWAMSIFI